MQNERVSMPWTWLSLASGYDTESNVDGSDGRVSNSDSQSDGPSKSYKSQKEVGQQQRPVFQTAIMKAAFAVFLLKARVMANLAEPC